MNRFKLKISNQNQISPEVLELLSEWFEDFQDTPCEIKGGCCISHFYQDEEDCLVARTGEMLENYSVSRKK